MSSKTIVLGFLVSWAISLQPGWCAEEGAAPNASVTVTGEVLHPGIYAVPRETTTHLSDILEQCGGLLPSANVRHMLVLRPDPQKVTFQIDVFKLTPESSAMHNDR
jgi:protein involved in polysaccharide export with SLBB domain